MKQREQWEQSPGFLFEYAIFFHDVGQKTNSIIKSFSKETRKQIYLSKLVNILNFCNEKVTFIVFHIKIQQISNLLSIVKKIIY